MRFMDNQSSDQIFRIFWVTFCQIYVYLLILPLFRKVRDELSIIAEEMAEVTWPFLRQSEHRAEEVAEEVAESRIEIGFLSIPPATSSATSSRLFPPQPLSSIFSKIWDLRCTISPWLLVSFIWERDRDWNTTSTICVPICLHYHSFQK